MLGFLFRLTLVALAVGVILVLFEFRWTGDELRIRNRFSKKMPDVTAPVHEAHPEAGRKQIRKLIEESGK